jgi:hypothetical protein
LKSFLNNNELNKVINTFPDDIYRKKYFKMNTICFICKIKESYSFGSWLHHYCYVCDPNDDNITKYVKNIACSSKLHCIRCMH